MERSWREEFDEQDDDLHMILLALRENICASHARTRRPQHTRPFTGHQLVRDILISHPIRAHNLFRMEPHLFMGLVALLESRGLLQSSRNVGIEEQLAIFMSIVGHASTNRASCEQFQHSSETVSRYFHTVLRAINSLAQEFIQLPRGDEPAHRWVRNTPFMDALGAIDGTHVPVIVRREIQERFRNRHGVFSQNVMVVVSFDMQFQFICAGWEGSAADMRVMQSCLDNGSFTIPEGKYYLVDAGYANTRGLLAPYRGARYHLAQFTNGFEQYRSNKDKFNHCHARLRNVVERAFGLLKRRFRILRVPAPFSVETQRDIVVACAVLHNYISMHGNFDPTRAEETNSHVGEDGLPDVEWAHEAGGGGHAAMQLLRDNIVDAL